MAKKKKAARRSRKSKRSNLLTYGLIALGVYLLTRKSAPSDGENTGTGYNTGTGTATDTTTSMARVGDSDSVKYANMTI